MAKQFVIPTKKTDRLGSLSDQSILIYGPPKIGKSTLASTFPDAVFLPCEPGLNHLPHYQIPTEGIIETWTEFQAACAALLGDNPFRSVVVDTVDLAYQLCAEHICKQRGVEYTGDLGHGKGWTLVANEFMRVMKRLAAMSRGLILISHAKEKMITKNGVEYTIVTPSLTESAKKSLVGMVDMILYMDIDEAIDPNDASKKIYRRVLRTRPASRYQAGDRTGRLPPIVVIDPEAPFANFKLAWEAGEKVETKKVVEKSTPVKSTSKTSTTKK